jgi:hypothetical protein
LTRSVRIDLNRELDVSITPRTGIHCYYAAPLVVPNPTNPSASAAAAATTPAR